MSLDDSDVSRVMAPSTVVVFCSILIVKHEWDRDERPFICVDRWTWSGVLEKKARQVMADR